MFNIPLIIGICLFLAQSAAIIWLIVLHARRKASESRLRELNRHLISAQEEERKRIARELHDDFGQRLALARIAFEMAMREDPALGQGIVRTRLESILTGIEELGDDIQHLSHTLHSARLQYIGLAAALRELCGQVEKQYHFAIDLQAHDPVKTVSREVELCIYRVAQEALHNMAKHSGADRAVVRLGNAGAMLRLEISDNGKGFNPDEPSQGLGLASMRERLSIIGGNLEVKSAPGRGTLLSAQVPFPNRNQSTVET